MSKKCPHCEAEIDSLDYNADYSETIYGRSWGTYDFSNGLCSMSDCESSDSDNFEEDNVEYVCPECGCFIDDPDDLEDFEEDDEVVESKKSEKLIGFIREL